MPKRRILPLPTARDALTVLGSLIRQRRVERGWTRAELARRLGLSVPTVTSIERGEPQVAIGSVFNAAELVGVELFGVEGEELARLRSQRQQVLALLPERVVMAREDEPDDDF